MIRTCSLAEEHLGKRINIIKQLDIYNRDFEKHLNKINSYIAVTRRNTQTQRKQEEIRENHLVVKKIWKEIKIEKEKSRGTIESGSRV